MALNLYVFPKYHLDVAFSLGEILRFGIYLTSAVTIAIFTNYARSLLKLEYAIRLDRALQDSHAMLEAERFLDSLVENIPNIVFVKNGENLRFVRVNRAAEENWGYSRDDLIGKGDYDFFPKVEADSITSKDRTVLESGRPIDIPEEPLHTRKGIRLLHTKKVPLLGPDGKSKFLLGISEDITNLVKATQERDASRAEVSSLEKERQLRERFIMILSHDLRTPLTAARSCAELLNKYPEKTELRMTLPQKIIYHIDRMDRMVRDLLDASRIKSDRPLTLEMRACDLKQVLSGTIEMLSTTYGNRFRLETTGTTQGYWSEDALSRAAENLLINAVKYGDIHAPITVRVYSRGHRVSISVHNFGDPIPLDELSTLFEPFERAKKVSQKGWGLGLTLVQGVAKAHGGVVTVQSSQESGTTFTLDLPDDARSYQKAA
jgi:PAS domain S-box-containing protein